MKRKVKITFEFNVEYPEIKKETKRLSKDFDNWLKSWSADPGNHPLPLLFRKVKGSYEGYLPSSLTKVKVVRDKEVIFDQDFEEHGEFGIDTEYEE